MMAHVSAFVHAFNRGDTATLATLYEDRGVLVPAPGQPMTGEQRGQAQAHLLGFGHPMRATLRHAYVADDIALLIVDWSIEGLDMRGTATDVVRRGADGTWRYVIDNPFGTA
jgi:ketosteroid isomerase-like protein